MSQNRDGRGGGGKRSLPRVPRRAKDPEVGYGRPPRATQFKPGQSGNPKGRPKGAKGESILLREILERKIATNSGHGRRKITVLEGILLRIAENALKGDPKSAAFLLNRFAALVSGELQPQDLSEDDRAVLEAFAQQATARKLKELGHEQQ